MKRRVGAAVDSRPVFCAFKTHRDVVVMRKMDETAERTRTSFLVENRTEMIRMWMSFICLENSETRRIRFCFPPTKPRHWSAFGSEPGNFASAVGCKGNAHEELQITAQSRIFT